MVLSTPAIFYSPHQDDETLSMAVDILNHIAVGRRCILVLYTDGTGSQAQQMINGQISSAWWGGTHDPAKEGYAPLDDAAFSQARNNEFVGACKMLGIPATDIFVVGYPAATVTVDQIKDLIRSYEAQYPGASHKCMSYYDSSPQHAVSGQALLELYNAGEVTDARFYVSRADWGRTLPGSIYTANSSQAKTIKDAARVYSAWNPQVGAYAVGYHSVHDQFCAYLANPQNKIHKPNE